MSRPSRRDVLAGAVFALFPAAGCAQAPGPLSVRETGARGDGRADDTRAVQAALDSSLAVDFPEGTFKISAPLRLRSDQSLTFAQRTTIRQSRPDTPIFLATAQNRLTFLCRGATFAGEGTYLGGADTAAGRRWTGNGGHLDQAFRLAGCNEVRIDQARIINCGHAGICLIGGSRISITGSVIEGTHRHRTPIVNDDDAGGQSAYYANFQLGIYLLHSHRYGPVDALIVEDLRISGTATGVVTEVEPGAREPQHGLRFSRCTIHDIPGQHGFYIQSSNTHVAGYQATNIRLAPIKIQAADLSIRNISAVGVTARDCGSQMFEVATVGPATGSIAQVRLEGTGENVARGLSISNRVSRLTAQVTVTRCTDVALLLAGSDLREIDVTLDASDVALDGVLFIATESVGVRIRARIRNANLAGTVSGSGIRVASRDARVELVDPDVSDVRGRMRYGLINEVPGGTVSITGSARFAGAAETAVRASGLIEGMPNDATLQGALGPVTNAANLRRRGN